jgi:hypothetical protein
MIGAAHTKGFARIAAARKGKRSPGSAHATIAEGGLWDFFLPRGGATWFVSADEVVSQRLTSYDMFPVSWLDMMKIGPDGLSYWSRAGSLDGGRQFQPGRGDYDMLDGLADRYVALRNGSPDIDAASV